MQEVQMFAINSNILFPWKSRVCLITFSSLFFFFSSSRADGPGAQRKGGAKEEQYDSMLNLLGIEIKNWGHRIRCTDISCNIASFSLSGSFHKLLFCCTNHIDVYIFLTRYVIDGCVIYWRARKTCLMCSYKWFLHSRRRLVASHSSTFYVSACGGSLIFALLTCVSQMREQCISNIFRMHA